MSTPGGPLRLESLCDPGQGGVAARQAGLPATTRRLHRAVLRTFLDVGTPPHRDDFRGSDVGDVVEEFRRLDEADLVHLDAHGWVAVAYPFSGRPTAHLVSLDGAACGVYAMCAIDALGIPLMTGRDGIIESRDPDTGHPIRIHRTGETWWWSPPETAVLLAQTRRVGFASDCLCPTITFHANEALADDYLGRHPDLTGLVLGQAGAVDVARWSFAGLLTDQLVIERDES